jgi:hypothetical protein
VGSTPIITTNVLTEREITIYCLDYDTEATLTMLSKEGIVSCLSMSYLLEGNDYLTRPLCGIVSLEGVMRLILVIMSQLRSDLKHFLIGVVAQLAERYLCKVKDAGSTPVNSTEYKRM